MNNVSKKLLLLPLVMIVFLGFSSSAHAESIWSALSRLFFPTGQQVAQVSATAPAPADMAAKISQLQQQAQQLNVAALAHKPTIGSATDLAQFTARLKTGAQAVTTTVTTGCPKGQVLAGSDGDSVVCTGGQWSPNPLLKTSQGKVSVGNISSPSGLSVTGSAMWPNGIWGQGVLDYGIGVIGLGAPFSAGVFGTGGNIGVEGDSSGYTGILGNHWYDASKPSYGYGVVGQSNYGPAVAGFGKETIPPGGGPVPISAGVLGYGDTVGGHFHGGLFGVFVYGGSYGIYQAGQGTGNHFDGPIDSSSDICTSLNGGKCLSTAGGGGSSPWLASPTDKTSIYNSNTGNVGIGTASPGAALEIKTANSQPLLIRHSSGTPLARLITGTGGTLASFNVLNSSGLDKAMLGISSTNSGNLNLFDNALTVPSVALNAGNGDASYINNGGNVGIGTTNPGALLTVGANTGVSNGEIILAKSNNGPNRAFKMGLDSNYNFSLGDYFSGAGPYTPVLTVSYTTGGVQFNKLAGTGNAYACLDANGTLFRKATPCV